MPRALDDDQIEAFRERICAVATRRFAESGIEGVTLRGLARELGCSAMTPYRYFESKEEIFEAVRVAAFRRFNAQMTEVAGRFPDPIERLRATGRQYVRFAQTEPHAYRIMFQLDQPEHDEETGSHAELEGGWQPLVDTMREAVERGQMYGDPEDLAHCAWVSMHGLVTLHLAGKLKLGRALEELLEPVLDTLVRGAKARPEEVEG